MKQTNDKAMAREFIDTNILIYAFSDDRRTDAARAILQRRCVTSVQSLNEFVNVFRRKLAKGWPEVEEILKAIRILCSAILPIDLETHELALDLSRRYQFNIFDALMVAAAMKAGCTVFYSEDLQHQLIVERQLQISNPFLATG